jgi:hypothetical protein
MSNRTEQINKALDSLPIAKTQEVPDDTQKQEEKLKNTHKNDENMKFPPRKMVMT